MTDRVKGDVPVHATKTYRWSRGIAPLILYLSTGSGLATSFTPTEQENGRVPQPVWTLCAREIHPAPSSPAPSLENYASKFTKWTCIWLTARSRTNTRTAWSCCRCVSMFRSTDVAHCSPFKRHNNYFHQINSIKNRNQSGFCYHHCTVIQKLKYPPFIIGNQERNF
jgi:hypothetical protein